MWQDNDELYFSKETELLETLSLEGRFAGTSGQFYGLLVCVSTAGTSPEGPFTGTFPGLESPSSRVSTWVGLEVYQVLNRVFILACSSARPSVQKL